MTSVSGSWIVPTVTGSGSGTTYSAIWVGIDGYNSNSVEQLGTEQDVSNGVAQYSVWWEMYPGPSETISMTIKPGDSITASVQYAGSNEFKLSISDTTTGKSFTTEQSSSTAARSSAEWIVEAPTLVGGGGSSQSALANFGTITFTNASATINGVTGPINDSAWQAVAINMVNSSGSLLDTTSALGSSGTSFTVTFDSTTGSSRSGGPRAGRDEWSAAALTVSSSKNTIAQPVPQSPGYVLFGVTPVPQAKRGSFGVLGDPFGS